MSTLPTSVRLQCYVQGTGALALGLALLTVPPRYMMNNPLMNSISTYILRAPQPHPPAVYLNDPLAAQAQSLHGFFCCAVGISYCMTFYRGWEEFMYLSIPVRVGIGMIGVGTAVLAPERMSPLLAFLVINDLLSGVYGALAMGGNWLGDKNWNHRAEQGEINKNK